MPIANRESMDKRAENAIGILLRAGVLLSAAIALIGGILFLVHYGTDMPNYRQFHAEPSELRHVDLIVRFAASLHSRGIIQLGLLLLIATPVARVAFSVWAFLEERDWTYVAVTLIVLALLVYSLIGLA
jgi:uncharacterized membrane protein